MEEEVLPYPDWRPAGQLLFRDPGYVTAPFEPAISESIITIQTMNNQQISLLQVRNLKTYFETDDGTIKAVDGVDFQVYTGEVLGLVGESGCGKSVTALSIMRLISQPGKIVSGEIIFEGKDLLTLSVADMNHLRGNRLSMIFQQPQSALESGV